MKLCFCTCGSYLLTPPHGIIIYFDSLLCGQSWESWVNGLRSHVPIKFPCSSVANKMKLLTNDVHGLSRAMFNSIRYHPDSASLPCVRPFIGCIFIRRRVLSCSNHIWLCLFGLSGNPSVKVYKYWPITISNSRDARNRYSWYFLLF